MSRPSRWIDVVFDGGPGPGCATFLECEDDTGMSVSAGEWIKRPNGTHALRIAHMPVVVDTPHKPMVTRRMAMMLAFCLLFAGCGSYDLEKAQSIKTEEPERGHVIKKTWEKGVWLLNVGSKGASAWVEVSHEVFQFAEPGYPVQWTTHKNDFNGTKTQLIFISGKIAKD